jgi:pyridine nucleotide-disulfide oxidoreductase family protein
MKHLVLLGGGHAHLHVLKALGAQTMASAHVTLVSPFPRQMYSGMVPGLVAGHYGLDDVSVALAPLAAAAKVEFLETSATAIDANAKTVALLSGDTLAYDVLSLDTGPVMSRDAIPGARQHALFVRPIEHFNRLWTALFDLAQTRALDVVVVGGGAAGVELVMALHHRLCTVEKTGARLSLVTGGTAPMPSHSVKVQARVKQALRRRQITVFEDTCWEVREGALLLGSGARLACDAPVMALGSSAPTWLANSGLALDEAGFIATGNTLQSTSHPDVFAAGDVASRTDVSRPRSGVYAVRAGPPLEANLRLHIGGGALLPYQPQPRSLNLLACGDRSAIASWGDWSIQGGWVWRWKDKIDREFVGRYRVG